VFFPFSTAGQPSVIQSGAGAAFQIIDQRNWLSLIDRSFSGFYAGPDYRILSIVICNNQAGWFSRFNAINHFLFPDTKAQNHPGIIMRISELEFSPASMKNNGEFSRNKIGFPKCSTYSRLCLLVLKTFCSSLSPIVFSTISRSHYSPPGPSSCCFKHYLSA